MTASSGGGGERRPSDEQRRAGGDDLLALMPFATALGIELDAAAADEVRGRMAWAPERCTAGGLLHGGALMALADSLGGICAYLNLPSGRQHGDDQLDDVVHARRCARAR